MSRDASRNCGEHEGHQEDRDVDMHDESVCVSFEKRHMCNQNIEGVNFSSTLLPHQSNNTGACDDEVFVDAVTELSCLPFAMNDNINESTYGNTTETMTSNATTTFSGNVENSNFGLLERCGRWLISIPRDDVVALQNTAEYRDFLNAFDRLGEAHRRTVMLERRHLLETEDATLLASSGPNDVDSSEADHSDVNSVHALTAHPFTRYQQYPFAVPESRRRRFSFLQHLAVDDILLRTFEYIDCSSLVRTGTTCHRFHELTNRSAEQRVASLADGRLLRSAMKMLRAREQIEGVNVFEESGQYVPIPMLGLRRRIKVSGAGDPEFNGIYFCTGSNGNGFLFTKPRVPDHRIPGDYRNFGQPIVGQAPLARAQLQHPIDIEGVENPVRGRIGVANVVVMEEADDNEEDSDQRDGGVDVLFGDEPNRSRLLRCVISKRFSNETILWYMSKEVEDEGSHEISQMFSFWAKLLVNGDASPDVCRYPSQTSILSRDGEPAWQSLSDIAPPIVELLD